jgi:periplasmic mercuric ion binding protein
MMLFIKILFLSGFMFFLSGCSDNEPEERLEPVVEKKKTLMSRETEIKPSKTESVLINIPTVICSMCKENISSAVEKIDGVISSDVNVKKKTAGVSFDPALTTVENIRQAISNAGYDADNVKRNINAYNKLDECCKIESNLHS